MRAVFLILFLSNGCAFISGPPDLSHVQPTDTDTDTDTDSDTDTDTDVHETGDTDVGSAPNLVGLTLRATPTGLMFAFVPTDSDNDLVHGSLHIEIDQSITDLQIPQEVDNWIPNAISRHEIPHEWSCDGEVLNVFVSLTDAAGHTSAISHETFTLNGGGTFLSGELSSLGLIGFPFIYCGDLPNPDDNFDQFNFRVRPGDAGSYQMYLSWDAPTTDLDLDLRTDDTASNILVRDNTSGVVQPAMITYDLADNHTYRTSIELYHGPATLWKFLLTPTQ